MPQRTLCSQCRRRRDTNRVSRRSRGRAFSALVCHECVLRLVHAQTTGRHYGSGWDPVSLAAALSAVGEGASA